jgi:hypothetical protein
MPIDYIKVADEAFWNDESDEWRQHREAAAAREREFLETGYWNEEEETNEE